MMGWLRRIILLIRAFLMKDLYGRVKAALIAAT